MWHMRGTLSASKVAAIMVCGWLLPAWPIFFWGFSCCVSLTAVRRSQGAHQPRIDPNRTDTNLGRALHRIRQLLSLDGSAHLNVKKTFFHSWQTSAGNRAVSPKGQHTLHVWRHERTAEVQAHCGVALHRLPSARATCCEVSGVCQAGWRKGTVLDLPQTADGHRPLRNTGRLRPFGVLGS